ncbi:MAG: transglutaminase-like domain-containing protein [Promethearchaeota archaeon]
MNEQDFDQYLQPTEFLDFNKKIVMKTAIKVTEGVTTDKEKAVALFYWVQNTLKYNALAYYPKIRGNLKASVSIRRKQGFCMSKAVTLSALARAVSIPARIHMVDIINHKISQKFRDFMGTAAFYCHAYSELWLNGKWVKATPVFDRETAIKGRFYPIIEFDGDHDALFEEYDPNGKKFVEYIGDYGSFTDVPIEKIDQIFTEKYPKWYREGINFSDFKPYNRSEKEPLSLKK